VSIVLLWVDLLAERIYQEGGWALSMTNSST
jgi:hypothetical protein